MPEIGLYGSGILTIIGELIAGAMAQHVAMDQEREFGGFARPGDHALIACHAQRRCRKEGGENGKNWKEAPQAARESNRSNDAR